MRVLFAARVLSDVQILSIRLVYNLCRCAATMHPGWLPYQFRLVQSVRPKAQLEVFFRDKQIPTWATSSEEKILSRIGHIFKCFLRVYQLSHQSRRLPWSKAQPLSVCTSEIEGVHIGRHIPSFFIGPESMPNCILTATQRRHHPHRACQDHYYVSSTSLGLATDQPSERSLVQQSSEAATIAGQRQFIFCQHSYGDKTRRFKWTAEGE